jgi:hypothetical protein
MTRMACAIALGGALLLGACQQGQQQAWIDQQPFPETQADLYRQFGTPDAIRRQGDVRWLRYDYSEGDGMTFGVRYYGLGLVLSRYGTQADRLWVRVDSDNRITAVEPAVNTDKLRYRLWPFGS